MGLIEEANQLRTEIAGNILTKIRSYGEEEANIQRFIKLITLHGQWNSHQNAVMFAIHNESYECAEAIIQILKNKPEEKQIKDTLRSLYKSIANFAESENVADHTAIVRSTKSGQHILAKILLESLEHQQQNNFIKHKERCKSDCSGDAHGEGCKAGYNLLMLALETSPDDGLLPSFIVDFVCKHQDLEYKTDIAIGKQKPEIYGQTPNGIRLAATTGKTELAIKLLKECLPPEECYRAFLEVGPPEQPEVSAMASVLKVNAIDSLEMLRSTNGIEPLRKTLNSPAMRNNFLHQEMAQEAIKYFNDEGLAKKNFLIPKPSELSRPMALIFYNTFSGTVDFLEDAKKEAAELNDALQSLGWGKNATKMISEKTFDELMIILGDSIEKERHRCSLFLLYITSHGVAGKVSGIAESQESGSARGKKKNKKKKKNKNRKPLSSGEISKIIDVVARLLPEFIPKVLIVDTCRVERKQKIHATLKYNNILLINTTVLGQTAAQYRYIPMLAKQIRESADGTVSFKDMHEAAAEDVKDMPDSDSEEEDSSTFQIPDLEYTASKKILLRKYDDNEHKCAETGCEEDIRRHYKQCLICKACLRWYHPRCANCNRASLYLQFPDMYEGWQCVKCDDSANGKLF